MDQDEAEARRALASLPGFSPAAAAAARLMRLPGLTNRVYKVETDGEHLCLRIPGPGTAAIIDRHAEEAHARAAAAAGLAPEILHFGADGVMLTRFIDGAVTLTPERLRQDLDAVRRVAAALRRLHDEAADFTRSFEVFGVIRSYAGLLAARGVELPAEALALLARADEMHQALSASAAPSRPCHCDPTGGNLLDTSERVWIVDWEYSAMNDPLWDLAYLALEAGFDAAQDRLLLSAYFGRAPEPAELARVAVHEAVADLLSGLWALLQHANGNPAADFLADARRRFGRGAALAGSPAFARQLDVPRRG